MAQLLNITLTVPEVSAKAEVRSSVDVEVDVKDLSAQLVVVDSISNEVS